MHITIKDDKFYMDGKLTYSDLPGAKPAALGRLRNSRMVQATFDDENPETAKLFVYPDGSLLDCVVHGEPEFDARGQVRRVSGIVGDVTEETSALRHLTDSATAGPILSRPPRTGAGRATLPTGCCPIPNRVPAMRLSRRWPPAARRAGNWPMRPRTGRPWRGTGPTWRSAWWSF